ncbi:alpha-tocopherol transfer protein-like isoform X2 [Parasteatoda tepidariorum]|uniref:alpha-tocopherol transfer protein-like isoform X2 n=1 Tax=Parasteatoda tepidariorum TaxID=114398 RepID=UPI0039BD85BD
MNLVPYDAVQLPKEEEDKAMAVINESEHSRKISLETLRNMLKDKEFKPSLDKEFLLAYLRAYEFDCDRTAHCMQTYYELVRDNPDYYKTCVLDALPKAYLNPFEISPFRMKDNSLLLIAQYSELPLTEKVYLDAVSHFYLMQNPINQICGFTVISDVVDLMLSKLPQYANYNWIRLGARAVLNSPCRVKKIHVVNASEGFLSAYKALSPLMPKKMVDMLQFHSDSTEFKDLHEFVPPEILPEKYGGHLKECELINGMKNILQMEDYYRKYFPL